MLLFRCHVFESNKDNLDRLVGEYYHYFKSSDGDSSNFIIDFDKVIPSEWDTLVYVKYNHYYKDSNSDALLDYMDGYLPDDKFLMLYMISIKN